MCTRFLLSKREKRLSHSCDNDDTVKQNSSANYVAPHLSASLSCKCYLRLFGIHRSLLVGLVQLTPSFRTCAKANFHSSVSVSFCRYGWQDSYRFHEYMASMVGSLFLFFHTFYETRSGMGDSIDHAVYLGSSCATSASHLYVRPNMEASLVDDRTDGRGCLVDRVSRFSSLAAMFSLSGHGTWMKGEIILMCIANNGEKGNQASATNVQQLC